MKNCKTKTWTPDPYLKAAFRRIWRWSQARRTCLKATKCETCGNKSGKLLADHIEPVIEPHTGFENWQVYYERMFNGKLQALCEKCHKAKTLAENKIRRQVKREKKRG